MNLQSMRDAAFSDPGHFMPEIIRGAMAASNFKVSKEQLGVLESSLMPDDSSDREDLSSFPELESLVQLMELQHELLKLQQDLKTEVKVQKNNVYAVYQAYQDRLDFLKEEAKIEKIIINKESESDFWSFIKTIPLIKKGSLFLNDNGNLYSTWNDGKDDYLGLEFFGDNRMRFVIFKSRSKKKIARVVGRDNQQGIKEQIRAFDLNSLLQS